MESFEALGNAINRGTVQHAKEQHKSLSLVGKWQQPSVDFMDSGSINPLDRVEKIIETSFKLGNPADTALSPVFYLAERFNFVILILPKETPTLAELTKQLHKVVVEFGRLIKECADALEDGRVTPDERRAIEVMAQHLYTALGLFMKQLQVAAE